MLTLTVPFVAQPMGTEVPEKVSMLPEPVGDSDTSPFPSVSALQPVPSWKSERTSSDVVMAAESRPLYLNVSVPLKPVFGVYVKDPSLLSVTLPPFAELLVRTAMNGSPSGSVSLPRTPGAAMLNGVFVIVLYASPFAVGGRLVLMMTVLEFVAEQTAAFVTVRFNVRLANAPAVNVMVCIFVALVIVPFVIVQA